MDIMDTDMMLIIPNEIITDTKVYPWVFENVFLNENSNAKKIPLSLDKSISNYRFFKIPYSKPI